MMGETYRAAIVGLTGIGARRPVEPAHLPLYRPVPGSHAAAYHHHPRTEVVGVCDIRQEALDDFKKDWQDVWPDMHYYTDYREMLEKAKPDLVSVVTPDHLHADITVDAANSGAKAILCEKPIATSLGDVDRMIAAIEATDVILSVEHTRRWYPSYHAARERIRSGEIGPLRGIVVNLLSRRSMLFRNGTHMLDMICFFAESDPQWVFAELEEGFDHFTEYHGDGGHDPATDPAASAYIHFVNGVRAFYNSLKVATARSGMQLICEEGTIEISDVEASVIRGLSHWSQAKSHLEIDQYMVTGLLGAVEELIRALENGGALVSPAHEARKTVELMLAILKSHELGNVRVDLPLK